MKCLTAGIGLQLLASLPAALYQAIFELEHLLGFLLGLPVLVGGRSTVMLYEETVRAVCGDRQDTLLGQAWWFFCLAGVQVLLIAVALAWRRRRRGRWRDPIVTALLLLVAGNAAMAVRWPWWGT